MVTYCYSTKDGTIHERSYPMGKAPKEIRVGRKVAKRNFFAERVGRPATKGWPLTCYASGVNTKQAGELRQHFKDIGVPTDVTPDGDPIYVSHEHRKRALKARGLHDQASFN